LEAGSRDLPARGRPAGAVAHIHHGRDLAYVQHAAQCRVAAGARWIDLDGRVVMMAGSEPDAFPFRLAPEDFGTPSGLYTQRQKECPVGQIRLPSGDLAHMVMGYEEVDLILRDRRFSRNFRYPGAPRLVTEDDMSANPAAIVNLDPPEHTRLRRNLHGVFSPGKAGNWRPVAERIVGDLLDSVVAAGPPADLVASYASLLPIRMICELLDVPPDDQKRLIGWTGSFFSTASASLHERAEANLEFFTYVRELVASRRAKPGNGLVDALIRAADVDGTLSEGELYQMIVALFIGGQENTSATLARGIFTLLRHREQYESLCADPGLIDGAVEEILRFDVPSEGAFLRVATEDVPLAAGKIPKGSAVQASLAAANRDESHFADPGRFDIFRDPNPHLTFGAGAHFCVGAPLARVELQVALGMLAARLPSLRLAVPVGDIRYAQDSLVRALTGLPVTW
jgi:cytochrome P450